VGGGGPGFKPAPTVGRLSFGYYFLMVGVGYPGWEGSVVPGRGTSFDKLRMNGESQSTGER